MCISARTRSAAAVSRASPTSWKIVYASLADSTAPSMSLFMACAALATHRARASQRLSRHSWKMTRAFSAASSASSYSFEMRRGKACA
eukprot:8425609-Heterocapsa_arctica.AAC.1